MAAGIRQQRNLKKHHWRKKDKPGHYEKYVKARNKLRNLTKQLYCNFETRLTNQSTLNPKKFWNYVSSRDHNWRSIKCLTTSYRNEVIVTQNIVDLLNEQFASVFTNEPNNVPIPNLKYNIQKQMSHITLTTFMVEKQLKSLDINKSAGPDNIHPCLLKEAACKIVPELSTIFQNSLDQKYVPSQWKLA